MLSVFQEQQKKLVQFDVSKDTSHISIDNHQSESEIMKISHQAMKFSKELWDYQINKECFGIIDIELDQFEKHNNQKESSSSQSDSEQEGILKKKKIQHLDQKQFIFLQDEGEKKQEEFIYGQKYMKHFQLAIIRMCRCTINFYKKTKNSQQFKIIFIEADRLVKYFDDTLNIHASVYHSLSELKIEMGNYFYEIQDFENALIQFEQAYSLVDKELQDIQKQFDILFKRIDIISYHKQLMCHHNLSKSVKLIILVVLLIAEVNEYMKNIQRHLEALRLANFLSKTYHVELSDSKELCEKISKYYQTSLYVYKEDIIINNELRIILGKVIDFDQYQNSVFDEKQNHDNDIYDQFNNHIYKKFDYSKLNQEKIITFIKKDEPVQQNQQVQHSQQQLKRISILSNNTNSFYTQLVQAKEGKHRKTKSNYSSFQPQTTSIATQNCTQESFDTQPTGVTSPHNIRIAQHFVSNSNIASPKMNSILSLNSHKELDNEDQDQFDNQNNQLNSPNLLKKKKKIRKQSQITEIMQSFYKKPTLQTIEEDKPKKSKINLFLSETESAKSLKLITSSKYWDKNQVMYSESQNNNLTMLQKKEKFKTQLQKILDQNKPQQGEDVDGFYHKMIYNHFHQQNDGKSSLPFFYVCEGLQKIDKEEQFDKKEFSNAQEMLKFSKSYNQFQRSHNQIKKSQLPESKFQTNNKIGVEADFFISLHTSKFMLEHQKELQRQIQQQQLKKLATDSKSFQSPTTPENLKNNIENENNKQMGFGARNNYISVIDKNKVLGQKPLKNNNSINNERNQNQNKIQIKDEQKKDEIQNKEEDLKQSELVAIEREQTKHSITQMVNNLEDVITLQKKKIFKLNNKSQAEFEENKLKEKIELAKREKKLITFNSQDQINFMKMNRRKSLIEQNFPFFGHSLAISTNEISLKNQKNIDLQVESSDQQQANQQFKKKSSLYLSSGQQQKLNRTSRLSQKLEQRCQIFKD